MIAGGQGRSPQDLQDTATVLALYLLAGVVLLALLFLYTH